MSKKNKAVKKVEVDTKGPVEVLVYDCVKKQRVVASFQNEAKWWYGTRLYKVYHPGFDGGFRWVTKLGRVLGSYNPLDGAPREEDLAAEKAMIKWLMEDNNG